MAKHSTAYMSDPYPAPRPGVAARILLAPLGALLYAVGHMPKPIVRLHADVLAFIAGRVAGYRRRIVRRNIADCFPELSGQERRNIERDFYRNLADYFFQTVRLAYLSPEKIAKHVTFKGLERASRVLESGRDIVLYTSHFGNWEYIPSLQQHMPGCEGVVYAHVARPLKNKWFNRFFHRLRSRFNVSVPMRQTARAMIGWRRSNRRFIIGFLSDQKPGHNTAPIDVEFMGRRTPFIEGTEQLARKFHTAVFYTDVRKLGRDRFEVEMVPVAEDAASMPEGELTARYAALLTKSIRRDAASYLWSHNRWRLPRK